MLRLSLCCTAYVQLNKLCYVQPADHSAFLSRSPCNAWLVEQAGELEGHNDDDCQDDHERDHKAHGAAVPGAAHDVLQLLLRRAHAAVCHLHVLVQIIQQPPVQVQFLVHCQRYVLRDRTWHLS